MTCQRYQIKVQQCVETPIYPCYRPLLTIPRTSSRNHRIKRRIQCADVMGTWRGKERTLTPRWPSDAAAKKCSADMIAAVRSGSGNEVALSSRSGMYRGAWLTRNGLHVGEASTDCHTTRPRKWSHWQKLAPKLSRRCAVWGRRTVDSKWRGNGMSSQGRLYRRILSKYCIITGLLYFATRNSVF